VLVAFERSQFGAAVEAVKPVSAFFAETACR